tara:strand:+ start:750 stop:929 length:180 start_codon:yes stop_codon:yes gene_type:complete
VDQKKFGKQVKLTGNNQQPDKTKLFINQIKNKIEQINSTLLNLDFDKKNIEIGSRRVPI